MLPIVFGLIWAIDAWFKWQPGFVDNFVGYLSGALPGQPSAVRAWIHFWINVVGINPRLFAYGIAIGETAIAIALILGVFSNLTYIVGAVVSFIIWSAAEGFGGPYTAGATDIGAAVIYVLVFAGLFLSCSGLYLGMDSRLTQKLGSWGFLASGVFHRRPRARTTKPKLTTALPVHRQCYRIACRGKRTPADRDESAE